MAITCLFPTPPPLIRLDFSLLEHNEAPTLKEALQPKAEPSTASIPPPTLERQPTPVLKPQRKALAKVTPSKAEPRPVSKPTEAAQETVAASPAQADAAPAETTQAQNTSHAAAGGATGAGMVEAYRRANFSAIRNAILANLHYPMMARRHGWGGKVEVAFLITPDGGVRELRIQASSGHEVLDEEAIAAIRRSAPFTPPRIAALLVMPVTFELN